MARPVILILGGYGVFGRRIAANLARHEEIDLVIAGRNPNAAATFVRSLGASRARSLAVDLARPDAISTLIAAKPAILVDTLGPFQVRNLALPRRCAERGIHYIDIADARTRVVDIASLDAVARVEHAAIISGASTVPALTTAVVDELVPNAREVVAIDVGITPGQRTPRGMATVRAILGYCGKPIPSVCGDEAIFGWGDLTRHAYPEPVGERWLSNVDTPGARSLARALPGARRSLDSRRTGHRDPSSRPVRTVARRAARRPSVAGAIREAAQSGRGLLRSRRHGRGRHACARDRARRACADDEPDRHAGRRERRRAAGSRRAGRRAREETPGLAGLRATRNARRVSLRRHPDARGNPA